MKQKMLIPLACLFLLLLAAPAMAGVNLNVNGKVFVPVSAPALEDGVTMATLEVISRTLGADLTVSGDSLTMNKNGNSLNMTVGSRDAVYNGQKLLMPQAPKTSPDGVMAPVRFVCETFGAQVEWQAQDQTVAVTYLEKRNGLSADEMLTRASEKMIALNTYKMKAKMDIAAQVEADGKNENISMSSNIDAAFQQKPLAIYIKQEMAGLPVPVTSEIVMDESGMYMTMPEQGWVKMQLPGMDIKALLEQSGNQDVVTSMEKMKDCGVIINYGNDAVKDGEKYWVVKVTMGTDSFNQYLKQIMPQIETLIPGSGDMNPVDKAEFNKVMNDLFKNLQVDMAYDLWIDQEQVLARYMDLDAKIGFSLTVPGESDPFIMHMQEKVNYEIYDLGAPVAIPDVSHAKNLQDIMPELIPETEK